MVVVRNVFLVSIVIGTSAWLGCGGKGDTGPAGPAGAAGGSGSGSQGPTGPSGNAGSSGVPGGPGATGPANTVWWRGGVATPGDSIDNPNTFDAGTWGPFNLSGHCFLTGNPEAPGEVEAEYFVSSTDPNAKYTDYGTASHYVENASFPPDGGATPVGYYSTATPPDSYFDGPYDGTFAALSFDLKTYITGGFSTGVNVGGDAGTACQFGGYMTQPP